MWSQIGERPGKHFWLNKQQKFNPKPEPGSRLSLLQTTLFATPLQKQAKMNDFLGLNMKRWSLSSTGCPAQIAHPPPPPRDTYTEKGRDGLDSHSHHPGPRFPHSPHRRLFAKGGRASFHLAHRHPPTHTPSNRGGEAGLPPKQLWPGSSGAFRGGGNPVGGCPSGGRGATFSQACHTWLHLGEWGGGRYHL